MWPRYLNVTDSISKQTTLAWQYRAVHCARRVVKVHQLKSIYEERLHVLLTVTQIVGLHNCRHFTKIAYYWLASLKTDYWRLYENIAMIDRYRSPFPFGAGKRRNTSEKVCRCQSYVVWRQPSWSAAARHLDAAVPPADCPQPPSSSCRGSRTEWTAGEAAFEVDRSCSSLKTAVISWSPGRACNQYPWDLQCCC